MSLIEPEDTTSELSLTLVPLEKDNDKASSKSTTSKSIYSPYAFNPFYKEIPLATSAYPPYSELLYRSPTADINGSFFKIGPFVYGGEVQDVKILEQKAVMTVPSTRGGQDFLVDGGEGDADIIVSMIFSGEDHIKKALIPLIALFRLSPVTSVDNEFIKTALYDKFTENDSEQPNRLAANQVDKLWYASLEAKAHGDVLLALAQKETAGKPTKSWVDSEDFKRALEDGVIQPPLGRSKESYTYKEWLAAVSRPSSLEEGRPFSLPPRVESTERTTNVQDPSSRIDRTGHVPVAMINFNVSTHPELPDSLLVNLTLRRINVGNYLRGFLQYRTVDNTPTSDPRNAYWLLRTISKYIEKYYKEPVLSNFGEVTLKYAGNDIILKNFMKHNDLTFVDANPKGMSYTSTDIGGTVVTQLSYNISNKFAFHRLAGEAYPTAQHMGISSGSLNLSIKTNDPAKFEQLHTYKSAADFFMRSIDKINRFNGWTVRCVLTELFNTHEYPNSTKAGNVVGTKTFYPISIASATSESPGMRDMVMSLAETSLDFFNEFGFALYTNGMTAQMMYKFYLEVLTHLNREKYPYNFELFFGSGDTGEKNSILTPDSIMAALLENQTIKTTIRDPGKDTQPIDYSIVEDSDYSARNKILVDIASMEVASQQVSDVSALRLLLETGASPFIAAGIKFGADWKNGDSLSDATKDAIIKENFEISDDAARLELMNALSNVLEPEPRRELYALIWRLVNTNKIILKDLFLNRLFVAMVKRKPAPYTDRLYDRTILAHGFVALERAIEIYSELIDTTSDKIYHSEFVKSKAVSNALVYTPDGSFEITKRRITAYPDFFYLTYRELFDLPEYGYPFGEDYWKKFGYTFQDFGIINPNPFSYSNDLTASLSANSTTRAQAEVVTTGDSPIPPSVFFYRDTEMDKLRTEIDTQIKDWVSQLKTLTVKVPIDVEFMLKEAGKFTGDHGFYDKDGNLKTIQELTPDQVSDLIDVQKKNFENVQNSIYRDSSFGDSARTILKHQHKKAYEQLANKYNITSRKQFADRLIAARHRKSDETGLAKDYEAIIKSYGDIDIALPIINTVRDQNSGISTRRASGLLGASTIKEILVRGATAENFSNVDELTDKVIKEDATGMDSSVVLSSSPEEIQNGVLKSTQSISDLRNDIIKAFPTFRLYIIDFNKGDRIFVKDNFYGYNAIQSIDITLDKNDADLAVIRVADPMGILQGTVLDDKLTWNKGLISDTVLPTLKDGPVENYLDRFQLRQGRSIQIRGGYSADPDNLDILFTGRIAEVQFGDIVTIVAQGWKAELLGKQVVFETTTVDNSSVKDLVVRTIRDANPAGLGQVLTYEEMIELKQLGTRVKLDDSIARSIQNGWGTFGGAESGYGGLEGWTGFHALGGWMRGADMRLKNIWVPDINKTRFNFMADITTTGWEGRSWIIPMQPAWEVLQNSVNYLWGYVCQVVPYDGEATLFFGRPEQLYYYTRGNVREATKYNKQLVSGKTQFSEKSDRIFKAFLNSNQYSFPNGWYKFLTRLHALDRNTARVLQDPQTDLLTVGISKSDLYQEVSPSEFSYKAFRKAFDLAMMYTWTYFGDDEGDLITDEYLDDDLEDHQQWVGRVMRKDFNESFKEISSKLGSETNAAMFLLTSFYGFSYKFIYDSMYPPVAFVKRLLSGMSPGELLGLSNKMIDNLDSIKSREKADDENTKGVDPSDAQRYLKQMDDAKDIQLTMIVIRDNVTQPIGGNINYTYEISYKICPVGPLTAGQVSLNNKRMESLTVYAKNHKTIDKLLGFYNGKAEISISNDDNCLKISYNVVNNSFPTPLVGENAIGTFLNKARMYFMASLENPELQGGFDFSVWDPEFQARSKELTSVDFNDTSWSAANDGLRDYILENIPSFKAFAYFLGEYLKNDSAPIRDTLSEIRANNVFSFPPSLTMKPFRDYHYVTNGIEIVQNSIAASTREMNNTVVIRGAEYVHTPNDWLFGSIPKLNSMMTDYDDTSIEMVKWATWPNKAEEGHTGWQFNDWISFSNKKIGVYTDININRGDQAAKVASNVLAAYMRPMYRNNLLLLGRSIKPWDHLFIDDKYVDMLGMVEVERVVHHYSVNQGWLTNVVPHLIAEANPSSGMLQRSIIANKFDNIFNAIDMALWATVIFGGTELLKPVANLGLSAIKSGAASTLKARPLAWSIRKFGNDRLKNFAGQEGRAQALNDQLISVRKALAKNLGPMLNTYLAYSLESFTAGEITRIMSASATVKSRSDQFPVVITPLLFKGMPLEAGVNGEDVSYWSATSKFYWFYTDFAEGVRDIYNFISGFNDEPNTSNVSQVYRQASYINEK